KPGIVQYAIPQSDGVRAFAVPERPSADFRCSRRCSVSIHAGMFSVLLRCGYILKNRKIREARLRISWQSDSRGDENMIQRFSHATIYVLDQDSAYDFYVKKLGLEVRTD